MKGVKKWFMALPLWGKALTLVIAAIIIYILYRKLMVYLQGLKVQQLANTTVSVPTPTGSAPISIDLGAKALTIYDAFYNYFGGMAEDEQTAIDALKSVPNNYINQLSGIYFALYAKNLKEDFTKYTDFDKVSYKFI